MNKIDLEILKLLHKNKNSYLSGQKISDKLNVSRTTIWKHIKDLRNKGYQIESITNKGYSLVDIPDKITAEEIKLGLKTDIIAQEIYVFDSLSSTNEKAKQLAGEGKSGGTVIMAEEQTAGRGRLGRKWYSPPGSGLWCSLLVRPDINPTRAPFLTIVAALALEDALYKIDEEFTIFKDKNDLMIKWPNDILWNDKKICGILSELNADIDKIKYAVIGIGVNVNQDSFPDELEDKAVSLKEISGKKISRNKVAQTLLTVFEKYYKKLLDKDYNQLLLKWKDKLNIIKKNIDVYADDKVYSGEVVDISDKGELVIKDNIGNIHRFWAGDVSLRQ
ncbi:MAG: biotin--[acetyl-CoA-carboxylase] ligase [Halothermotrichaceae bacterium]